MKHKLLFVAATFISLSALAADKVTITVQNPLAVSREFEVVEVDAQKIKQKLGSDNFIVTDADDKEITSQVTYDGKLIFQASVGEKGKSKYYAKAGTPQQYNTQAKGRLFHERGTEFGWENDCVAYRIYGGGAAVGYDLFNKSTDELMLDYWYASEQDQEMRRVSKSLHDRGYHTLADQVYNAYCYHIDHGKGMDCYTVGPTLGGGANALVNQDGSLCMPKCYEKYEILDNGPLRFTVKLTYPEVEYEGQKVRETRLITLDAGSRFNKVYICYDGIKGIPYMASGVVVHKQNSSAYVMNKESGYVGYEDLGDASVYNKVYQEELAKQMGKIYVGTIYPTPVKEVKFLDGENGIAIGHALAYSQLSKSHSITYYFGSGWNKNPNSGFYSLTDWEAYLSNTVKKVKNPMKVNIK